MTALSYSNQIFIAILVVAVVVTVLAWTAIEIVKALLRLWKERRWNQPDG
jgi:hypothetical protein